MEILIKKSEISAQAQNTRSSLSSTSFLGDQEEQNAYNIIKIRREQASSTYMNYNII